MAEGVRRDADLGQGRPGDGRDRDALLDNVPESEPREGTAGRIHKKRDIVREANASIPEHRAHEIDRLGPQRTEPLLPAFAQDSDLDRGVEPDGGQMEVDHLLGARPGVIEELDERDITPSTGGRAINGAEQMLDIGARQAGHRSRGRLLGGDG